jgi:hypothetical protein
MSRRGIAYRHALPPPPWGRGRRPKAGRGGGYRYSLMRERQGRGNTPPSPPNGGRAPGVPPIALPVSPSSHLRCSNSCRSGSRSPNGDIPSKSVHRCKNHNARQHLAGRVVTRWLSQLREPAPDRLTRTITSINQKTAAEPPCPLTRAYRSASPRHRPRT